MKFHEQMIRKIYNHTAQILYDIKNDPELQKVKTFAKEKEYIYQAVHNDYLHRCIAMNQIDFFSDSSQYENLITGMAVMLNHNIAVEQNMILYNVNYILETIVYNLKNARINKCELYNIGFIGIDVRSQQLHISDIENRVNVRYQLMIDRNIDNSRTNVSSFSYHVRMRFLTKEIEN